jgi:hypothetical protein
MMLDMLVARDIRVEDCCLTSAQNLDDGGGDDGVVQDLLVYPL